MPTRRNPRFATGVVLAVVLLMASGRGYRALSREYLREVRSVPIPAGTLGRLPLVLGEWKGVDVPLSKAVVKATATDDHVNRRYRSAAGSSVSVFVAYGVRFRDLTPHRPEVCYPGAGWTLSDTESVQLSDSDSETIPCRILHFNRAGLESRRIVVLNYYIVDGKYCADVSLLRSKAWRTGNDARYAAQVQIVASRQRFGKLPADLVRDFARQSAKPIYTLLEDAVGSAATDR